MPFGDRSGTDERTWCKSLRLHLKVGKNVDDGVGSGVMVSLVVTGEFMRFL